MTVGQSGFFPHAPATIGCPSVSRIVGSPPKRRIVSAASLAFSRIAFFFVGSTETLGISTKSFRRASNDSLLSAAYLVRASRVRFSVFMRRSLALPRPGGRPGNQRPLASPDVPRPPSADSALAFRRRNCRSSSSL